MRHLTIILRNGIRHSFLIVFLPSSSSEARQSNCHLVKHEIKYFLLRQQQWNASNCDFNHFYLWWCKIFLQEKWFMHQNHFFLFNSHFVLITEKCLNLHSFSFNSQLHLLLTSIHFKLRKNSQMSDLFHKMQIKKQFLSFFLNESLEKWMLLRMCERCIQAKEHFSRYEFFWVLCNKILLWL